MPPFIRLLASILIVFFVAIGSGLEGYADTEVLLNEYPNAHAAANIRTLDVGSHGDARPSVGTSDDRRAGIDFNGTSKDRNRTVAYLRGGGAQSLLWSYEAGDDLSSANGTLTRGSTARQFDGNQWVEVGQDTPRDGHYFRHPVTGEIERSLLVEEARENRLFHSNNIINQWNYNGAIFEIEETSPLIASEKGFHVTGLGTGGWNMSAPSKDWDNSGEPITISVIYEEASSGSVKIRVSNGFFVDANFPTGEVIISNDDNLQGARMERLSGTGPNGGAVWRFIATVLSSDDLSSLAVIRRPNNGPTYIVHHAQIEEGASASSPVVTGSDTDTRAEDVITFSPVWSEQEVTQYVRYFDYETREVVENVTTSTSDALLSQPQAGRAYTHIGVAEGALTVEEMRTAVGAPEPPELLEPNTTIFPQEQQYQIKLYNWLQTLTVEDVASPKESISFSAGSASNDELYGLWLLSTASSTRQPPRHILRAPDGNFVLDNGDGRGFEADGENIRVTQTASVGDHVLGLMGAAWWAKLDIPGIDNPYLNNDIVKRRLLAQAAVELMALDQFYTGRSASNGDNGGMALMDHAYVFYYLRDVLPADLQEAFIVGYDRIIRHFNTEPIVYPRDVNSNMDSKGIAAATYIAKAAKEMGRDDIHDYARDSVRTWLLGSPTATVDDATAPQGVLFHGAGHHTEQGGPASSYLGINIYYWSKAAGPVYGLSDWEWFWGTDGVIDRQVRWMMYQHFPEPDGTYDGPSGYSKRLNGSTVSNQSYSEGRDAWLAMLSDYGKGLLREPRDSGSNGFLPTSSSMMEGDITSFINSRDFSPIDRPLNNWSHSQRWSQRWSILAHDYFLPGTYDAWSSLQANDDEILKVPYARTGNFSRGLGLAGETPEWWFYKDHDGSQDFGFMLGATKDAGDGYGSSSNPTRGYRGGGALETFWTREGGIFVLSRIPNRFSSSANSTSNIDRWSVSHVWGRNGGDVFSIAGRRITESVTADDNTEPSTLTIRRTMLEISSEVEIEASATNNGLEMKQTIFGAGGEEADELWASIPVLIRHNRQDASTETSIDYWDGSAWQALAEETPTSTDAVRLGRDWGSGPSYAYVQLDEARDVQLSELFVSSDQENSRSRTLHIDFHENRGTSLPIPSVETVTYWLTTSDPTEDNPVDDPPDDEPEDEPDTTTFENELQSGWNLMSLNVAPESDALEDIFAAVLEDILVVKNTDGALFSPEFELNTIGPWRVEEGYWVFAGEDVTFSVEGVPLTAEDTPITLQPGWQQVAFIGSEPIAIEEALADIMDELVMVSAQDGALYFPAEGISTLSELVPGQAYLLNVTEETTLTYPASVAPALSYQE